MNTKLSKDKVVYTIGQYGVLTVASVMIALGMYIFRFPNNFSFGGVSGISVVLARFVSLSASDLTMIFNVVLLIVQLIIFGWGFSVRTTYVTAVMTAALSLLENLWPISAPLTDEPLLELMFAVGLPGIASAILFNMGASSGGTDIIALIIKKYAKIDTGVALFFADAVVVGISFFVFDVRTGLFSVFGLLVKSIIIDDVIESINQCKVFTIITSNYEPVKNYITDELHRSATVSDGQGAYTGQPRKIIITIVKKNQAVDLRNFVRQADEHAFISITNSSEIIGKGFRMNL